MSEQQVISKSVMRRLGVMLETKLFSAKPFIIAEVGSNWENLEHCLESIEAAKRCGADAVKFQAFDFQSLYGLIGGLPHELPITWLPGLKAKADACGIEFLCTAFSPELVAEVDKYVQVHKIASSDAACPQMLEAVCNTGKPVLISFGGKSDSDKAKALSKLEGCEYVRLQCTAAYPADYVDLSDLSGIGTEYDGLSDHTLGYTAAVEAARKGAIVIEKHFTALPDLDTPDTPHSLNPKQFKRMVDIIRGREVETEEGAMYLRCNRRLIAIKDIKRCDPLEYGVNFGSYRSLKDDTRGLSPWDWETVQGKSAQVDISRGDSIGTGDFA